MRFDFLLSALVAPLSILAAPVDIESRSDLANRQARPTKPAPCVRALNTTEAETKTRSDAFAQAFIYKKDISEAFKYISQDYIVCATPAFSSSCLEVVARWRNRADEQCLIEPQSRREERL